MRSFIEGLTERNYQNRKVAIIENGTWAPMTGKLILGMFEKSKNLTFTETKVSIKSAMNAQNKEEIEKTGRGTFLRKFFTRKFVPAQCTKVQGTDVSNIGSTRY